MMSKENIPCQISPVPWWNIWAGNIWYLFCNAYSIRVNPNPSIREERVMLGLVTRSRSSLCLCVVFKKEVSMENGGPSLN